MKDRVLHPTVWKLLKHRLYHWYEKEVGNLMQTLESVWVQILALHFTMV